MRPFTLRIHNQYRYDAVELYLGALYLPELDVRAASDSQDRADSA